MTETPAKRGKRVSEAEFRRMWADLSISQSEIGRRLGISGEAVRFRASARKLPPRPKERPFAREVDHARAVRLYLAGLSAENVAKMLGCSRAAVKHAVTSAGHPMRSRNLPGRPRESDLLRHAMAASAREEQAAMALAEMVDRQRTGGDGRRAA